MKATKERDRDEYGRAVFAHSEIPPATEHFAHWRGKLTSGYEPGRGSTVTPRQDEHARLCVGGWIPSGEWWLHCGVCRRSVPLPEDTSARPENESRVSAPPTEPEGT